MGGECSICGQTGGGCCGPGADPSDVLPLSSVEGDYDIIREKEMLQIAADYIRKFHPGGMVHYDEGIASLTIARLLHNHLKFHHPPLM